jgi:hypothetical protein
MKKSDLKTGWKRQEYTDRQKEIFRALKTLGFNWIAEDEGGCIFVYENKPTKDLEFDIWDDKSGTHLEIYIDRIMNHLDFVKWEDEEPFEIPTL